MLLHHANVFRSQYIHAEFVCLRCLSRLSARTSRRQFGSSPPRNEAVAVKASLVQRDYFFANRIRSASNFQTCSKISQEKTGHEGAREVSQVLSYGAPLNPSPSLPSLPVSDSSPTDLQLPELPHRRRKRLKAEAALTPSQEPIIPPDVSSRLTSLSTTLPATSIRRLLTTCLSLSKPRLSFMIVLTTAAAYSLYPIPALLLPTTTTAPSLSTLTLMFLTIGTSLCCTSANALNMLLEPEHDAKMSRTRNRPIVRGLIGKKGALIFASITAVIGIGSLWFVVNPTVAFLGGLNIVLYAGVYTPMKRLSVLNTWVGALVGGIPPLMGWAAAAGQSATGNGEWSELLFSEGSIGGWLLAGILYAWQFPHFNALSWSIREEYKNAGYRMLVWTNPRMNGRVALRYAFALFPLCAGLWWWQITDQGFLVTSSIVNIWIAREAWKFWRKEGQRGSARGLFWASVWHLPVVMVLAMVHKKGLWDEIWRWLVGSGEEEEEEEENMLMTIDSEQEVLDGIRD
ncbi:Protoheme IX farnesyltransferase, mitochondrial [Pseudocyphellaria aurata]|nr:Protoheme IX farnesyltransferase, mitochondrial [Pseudocyphellaria aurata]